jgi:hypothetical protein
VTAREATLILGGEDDLVLEVAIGELPGRSGRPFLAAPLAKKNRRILRERPTFRIPLPSAVSYQQAGFFRASRYEASAHA